MGNKHNLEEFVQIIQQHEGIIYKITRAYEANPEYQKDLYQEVVFQLWKAYPSFRKEAKISTWIYRVALNTSLTYRKRGQKQRNHVLSGFQLPEVVEEEDSFKEEQIRQLYQQIQRLKLVDRALILLYLEGKSYEEIGSIMGFSSTNVGTRLNRIKNKLRTLVNIED